VACEKSSCVVATCNAGYADCNGSYGDGCEANVTNDPLNCGACGYSCSGRPCENGACLLTDPTTWPVVYMAIDVNNIYWATGSYAKLGQTSVFGVAKSGGFPWTLATQGGGNDPSGVASDGKHVFWADDQANTIIQVDWSGANMMTLAQSFPAYRPFWVATDGMNVFWMDSGGGSNGSLYQIPVGGGTPTQLAGGIPGAGRISVAGGTVYWTSLSEVQAVPVGGGNVTAVAWSQSFPDAVVANGSGVFWMAANDVMGLLTGATAPIIIVPNQQGLQDLASDGVSLYWLSAGKVSKVPLGGGMATILVPNQVQPEGLAVDDTSVYWYDHGTATINKARK
jgi:hypothetical protein